MNQESKQDEQFLQRAKSLFDDSVDGMDAATQSKLKQARHAAIEAQGAGTAKFGRWTQMVPAAGITAAAVVAVIVWNGAPQVETMPKATDLEIIMTEDSLEMLEDLEFYSWLEIEDEFDADENAGSNVS